MGSSFGTLFRVTTFGESHGPALGCVVEGCPPRLALSAEDLVPDLERRRPGQSALTTQRKEADAPQLLSGVHEGLTTGTPIAVVIASKDARPKDYSAIRQAYRPSHADYVYDAKYGHRDPCGGGRSSARETAARVAAGAIARRLLAERAGVSVQAWVQSVGSVSAPELDPLGVTSDAVEATPVRCPDPATAAEMIAAIDQARRDGDSIGGVVSVVAQGVPPGWGAPVFDKLEADLAKGMLSIPAVRGFEIGSGFAGTRMRGSEHNDAFAPGKAPGSVTLMSNHAGGTLGGISSGAPIVCRVAFKPTATIMSAQPTVDRAGNATELAGRGRHDPCVLPRAVVIVEAMMLLVLADHFLRHEAQCGRPTTGHGETAGDARLWTGIAPSE
ncbi:chorismate synthase [Planctomycetota bacterium]|nr:chorismate synthase [Planctomycetota bacterium]